MFNPKNILVTTDFSEDSDRALEEAMGIAKKFNSKIHLLHVLENVQACAVDFCLQEFQLVTVREQMIREAKTRMNRQIKRISKKNIAHVPIVTEIRFGDAYNEILNAEMDDSADLLVTAPHKVQKMKLFSHLTSQLAKNSPCETLLVRA
jgi:nucleotide-binding universal stress UspA family protein